MPFSALQQGSDRKIAIAVDLSDESAYAVKWAVANYLRPGDSVVILHVRPTSVLFGADWGASDQILEADKESQQKMEDDFDIFTSTKSADLAKPLSDAKIPYKIHIVKDHDMKERICLEVERLGVNAVIMGSRGKDWTTFFQYSRFPGLCVIARNPLYLQITSTCVSWWFCLHSVNILVWELRRIVLMHVLFFVSLILTLCISIVGAALIWEFSDYFSGIFLDTSKILMIMGGGCRCCRVWSSQAFSQSSSWECEWLLRPSLWLPSCCCEVSRGERQCDHYPSIEFQTKNPKSTSPKSSSKAWGKTWTEDWGCWHTNRDVRNISGLKNVQGMINNRDRYVQSKGKVLQSCGCECDVLRFLQMRGGQVTTKLGEKVMPEGSCSWAVMTSLLVWITTNDRRSTFWNLFWWWFLGGLSL